MKKIIKNYIPLFLLGLAPITLSGCNIDCTSPVDPVDPVNPTEPTDPVEPGDTDPTDPGDDDPIDDEEIVDDEPRIDHISLNESELILKVGKKYQSLTVNFYPADPSDTLEDVHDGVWSSSNESVATVRYGIVTAVSKGKAIIKFVTDYGKRVARCTVYVVENESQIQKTYQKVDDFDSIKHDDEIIFACPEANLAASLTRKDGYLVPVSCSFSSDKKTLTNIPSDVGKYLVTQEEDGLSLLNQSNEYLAAKYLKNVLFLKGKGDIEWAFETIPDGEFKGNYVYSVKETIDGWLMFNTKAMRFTLYDSNEQVDMFRTSVYRLTISLEI